ncbi:MAG: hypothetical protein Q8877_03400, partial [Sweet potato little leaf phytoplasma]|nr:hypothetical protein [Sweet potato little leaf phytoplasma]
MKILLPPRDEMNTWEETWSEYDEIESRQEMFIDTDKVVESTLPRPFVECWIAMSDMMWSSNAKSRKALTKSKLPCHHVGKVDLEILFFNNGCPWEADKKDHLTQVMTPDSK